MIDAADRVIVARALLVASRARQAAATAAAGRRRSRAASRLAATPWSGSSPSPPARASTPSSARRRAPIFGGGATRGPAARRAVRGRRRLAVFAATASACSCSTARCSRSAFRSTSRSRRSRSAPAGSSGSAQLPKLIPYVGRRLHLVQLPGDLRRSPATDEDVDERFGGFHLRGGAEYQAHALAGSGRRSGVDDGARCARRRRRVGSVQRDRPWRHQLPGQDHDRPVTPFERKVLRIVSRIPAGRVTTYGDVARWRASPARRAPSATSCGRPTGPGCPTTA